MNNNVDVKSGAIISLKTHINRPTQSFFHTKCCSFTSNEPSTNNPIHPSIRPTSSIHSYFCCNCLSLILPSESSVSDEDSNQIYLQIRLGSNFMSTSHQKHSNFKLTMIDDCLRRRLCFVGGGYFTGVYYLQKCNYLFMLWSVLEYIITRNFNLIKRI